MTHRVTARRGAVLKAVLVAGALLVAGGFSAPGASAAAFAATASVDVHSQFVGDTGTDFTFTVTNTGTTDTIAGVVISRPSSKWTITTCPQGPAGWTPALITTVSDTKCRYTSAAGTADDIAPSASSSSFVVRANSAAGAADATGNWVVFASRTTAFGSADVVGATAAGAGLGTTAYVWEITDAVVSTSAGAPGTNCPPPARTADAASTQVIVLCGKNHGNAALTPVAAQSSLSGSFIQTSGTFASGSIAASSPAPVVLGDWSGVTVGSAGAGKTVVATTGSSATATSPSTTLTGYTAVQPSAAPVLAGIEAAALGYTENGPAIPVTSTLTVSDADSANLGGATVTITAGYQNGADVLALPSPPAGITPSFSAATGVLTLSGSAPVGDYQTALRGVTYVNTSDTPTSAARTLRFQVNDGAPTNNASNVVSRDITVVAVNDVPSFTKGPDQTVNEDAGAQTVNPWATAISTGPADESTQTVSFTVTNDNNALFSSQPAVSPTGVLTYTPAANANGSATVSVTISDNGGTANGGVDTSAAQTFTITVNPVNDVPSFTKGPDQTVNEDAGAQTVDPWATALSKGPANESAQTLSFAVTNNNNALFSSQPAVSPTGALTYTPAANANGSATVSVTLSDNGGTANGGVDTSAAQTFTITVNPVNDPPSFTAGPNQTVAQDAGAQSVNPWATGMSPGPADEAAQTLTFNVTNDNNALFSAQPAVDATTGTLTYTPAAGKNGSAIVSVTLSDNGGGTNTSAAQTFTITVSSPGAAPTAANDSYPVVEDTPISPAAPGVLSNDTDPDPGDTLTAVLGTGPAMAASFTLNADGSFSYTPAANVCGSDSFTYQAKDQANLLSALATVTLPITCVNDAPSFTKGADQTSNEDAGAQSVPNWATAMSTGPADESTQTLLGFTATNDNNALFSTQPAVSNAGTLTYTAAPNANGSATVSVTLKDNGGTANGGVDTSAAQTFTITVNPVNDAPSFTKGPSQTVNEDAGAQTVDPWATALSKGPANESTQTLTFNVTNDNNALFSSQPAVSPSGALTYTPAANANGSATVSVTISDNGGTANGGADTSAAQTFTITVNPVNDPPSFTKGPDQTVGEDAGAQTVNPWVTAISAGPADESTQTLTFNVTNDNNALFSSQPAVSPTGVLTYTPAANASGSATVSVTLSDSGGGTNTSAAQTFTITVTAANDAPTAVNDSYPVIEDTPISPAAPGVLGNDTDPDVGDTLTAVLGTGPANAASFTLNANGSFSYTPAANFCGSDSFTYQAKDAANALSNAATVSLPVTCVNDAPSFTKGADQTVFEDAGAQSVPNWATAISPGPADEAGQTLTFTATNDNNALFAVQPAVSTTGTLTYTPAANANGSATVSVTLKDSGGTANSGADTSGAQTFTITVTPVNDPPTFTKGANQTVAEDAGAQTVPNWATAISAGPANEAGQTLTFIVSNDNNGLFSAQPAVSPTGTLTYTPAANANGLATVTVSLQDNGGAPDLSPPQTFTITVTPVNDPPSFTKGADQTVLEDAGAQSVPNWATAISAGPADEAGQTLAFAVTNNNNSLFSGQPAVSPAGTLTYTAAANANGSATVSVTLSDNGGGANTSATQTFTITVTAVNDAPSFTKGANQSVAEDSGAQTVNPWATAISKGPANESTQTLNFIVTNDNNALFSVQPAVSPTGVLTYTSAPDANGSATVTVAIHDDGGTLNGGVDTSANQTFTITITPVNDAPRGVVDVNHNVSGNVQISVAAPGLRNGVFDIEGDTMTAQVDASNASTGNVVINADGSYTYDPKPGFEGTDTVKFKVCDNGTPPGPACSAVHNLNLTISGMIWFIDNTKAAAGDGRATAPFNTLAGFQAVNDGVGDHPAANDNIFIDRSGATDYVGPVTLLNGQKLFGKGATASLTGAASLTGITLAPDSIALPTTSGTAPRIVTTSGNANAVNLNSVGGSNTIRGIAIGNTNGTGAGIAGTGFGTLTSSETAIGPSRTGAALNLLGGTANVNFTDVSSTSSTNAVTLSLIDGTLTLGTSSSAISGYTNNGFVVPRGPGAGASGTATITYPGTITGTAGTAVSITGKTAGTVTFGGAISQTGGSGGISLNSNTGATITFSSTITLSGALQTFSAAGGGTVNAADANNVIGNTTAATGPALTVANTTIGASGLKFRKISATGGTAGIVLDTTGTSGGLTVTGTGTAGTGGTIQNASNSGIQATNTMNLNLSWMNIANNGDALNEGGVRLVNVTGTGQLTSSTVTGSYEDNVYINNTSGLLTAFNIQGPGCSITNNNSTQGNTGISVLAAGTSTMTVTINNCSFSGNRTDTIHTDTADSSNLTATITNNRILGGSPNQGNIGIDVSSALTSTLTYDVENNKIGTDGVTNAPLLNHGINVFAGNTSTVTGKVLSNTIRLAGAGFSGTGIRIFQQDSGTVNAKVESNTVSNVGFDFGIDATDNGSGTGASTGKLNVGVRNNNVSVLTNAINAIRVRGRRDTTTCASITGNTASHASPSAKAISISQANTAVYKLETVPPPALGTINAAQAQSEISTVNTGSAEASADTNFTAVAVGSCTSIPT